MSRDRTDAGAETATLLLCLRAARSFRFIASVPPASSDVPLRQFADLVPARQRPPFPGDARSRAFEHEKNPAGVDRRARHLEDEVDAWAARCAPSLANPAEAALGPAGD